MTTVDLRAQSVLTALLAQASTPSHVETLLGQAVALMGRDQREALLRQAGAYPITPPAEVAVPVRWGMFTARGNARLTGYARTCQRRVVVAAQQARPAAREQAAVRFVRNWRTLEATSGFTEAGDTAVREAVWAWLEDMVGSTLAEQAMRTARGR